MAFTPPLTYTNTTFIPLPIVCIPLPFLPPSLPLPFLLTLFSLDTLLVWVVRLFEVQLILVTPSPSPSPSLLSPWGLNL